MGGGASRTGLHRVGMGEVEEERLHPRLFVLHLHPRIGVARATVHERYVS